MKMFFAFGALVAFATASAAAADGRISDHSLARMGLSSMKIMSDVDGMTIRGEGSFGYISGGSGAHLIGAGGGSNFKGGTTSDNTTVTGKSSSTATNTLRIGYFSASFTASASTTASISISSSKGGKY